MPPKSSKQRLTEVYANEHFQIEISTDDRTVLRLVDNYLDFEKSGDFEKLGKAQVRAVRLRVEILSSSPGHISYPHFVHHTLSSDSRVWRGSLCSSLAEVQVDTRQLSSRAKVASAQHLPKEYMLYFALFKPIRVLLASKSMLCIHASAVAAGNTCMMFCGPKHTGKSSFAFEFLQRDFALLCDDSLFIQAEPGHVSLHPFPTKMGFKEHQLAALPKLKRKVVRDYLHGGKPRVSLRGMYAHRRADYERKVLVFPKFRKSGPARLKSLSREEAIKRLFAENPNVLGERSARTLSAPFFAYYALASESDCVEVSYSDSSRTAAIDALLARTQL